MACHDNSLCHNAMTTHCLFTHNVMISQWSTLPQYVLLYSDKTSCLHSIMSQYVFGAESSIRHHMMSNRVCGVCEMTSCEIPTHYEPCYLVSTKCSHGIMICLCQNSARFVHRNTKMYLYTVSDSYMTLCQTGSALY